MLKHRNGLLTWGLALALVGPAALSGQQPADTTQPGLKPYVVGEALPPVEQGQTLLPMSLNDAIQRALKANLNIQTANLNPEIQHYSLLSAEAAFTPTFSITGLGYRNSTRISTSTIQAGSGITLNKSNTYTFSAGFNKPMRWLGGQFSASFNNSRDDNNSQFSIRNPSYNSTLSLNYSQPLLAGLTMDNQRAALQTQQIQTQITDLQVKAQVANITNQVRRAYWALRYAIEQIEIQRRNLEQANELLRQDSLQVRLGRMTTSQMLQAAAQVAAAEQALLNAQVQWHTQDLTFKSLLVSGPTDPLLNDIINPTDRPTEAQQNVDIQAAIQVALKDRTDIREQRQQRDISQVNLKVSKSNTLPTLDLTAGYSLSGVGGDLYSRNGIEGAATLVSPGGYTDALTNIRNFDAPTWNISLSGSYPIGTNPNKTNLERAKLQLQQSDLALKSQELTIITQVTNAGYAVRNAYLQLQAAQRSVEAAQLSYQGVVQSFGVGAATNYEVVQAQNTLTTARVSELNAVISYVDAIAQFELVQHVGSN
ncbi:MAG: TolC family protein [Gemmatimonadetes bacterium]|nr:TolC family protein [Gemmatimonadota bacterium]